MKKNIRIKIRLIGFFTPIIPSLIFLGLCLILPSFLIKYSNIGPVNNGQPVFNGYYTQFVSLLTYFLLALSSVSSVLLLVKKWNDFKYEKYILPFLILILLPVQYIASIGMFIEIWGK